MALHQTGLKFTADGAVEFQKTLKEINSELEVNYRQYELQKSQMDKNASTYDKLSTRLEFVQKQQDTYTQKVSKLRDELYTLETAENRSEEAINKKKTQLLNAEKQLNEYTKSVEKLERELKNVKWTDFAKGLDKVGDGMVDAGKKMSILTGALTGLAGGALYSAMELEATEAKYNTVFDGMTEASDNFIKKFQELTPATTAEARNMASGIQDLLIPMGFMRDEATELTGETLHLIGALTNFNSGTHTAEQVAGAFQSALTGSYESLKRLGIQVNKEQVTNKAYELGLAKQGEEVTKQMEAQALMALAYEQSGDALAGYTEENLDAKTKMGLFKAELQDVGAEFGEQLLPILSDVIDVIRDLVSWFSGLTTEQKTTILIIGGIVGAIGPLLIMFGSMAKGLSSIITLLTSEKIALLASKVSTIAKTVATSAASVAQFVWNGAMALGTIIIQGMTAALSFMLSPIGLVIIAIAAIIAIIVLFEDEVRWAIDSVFGLFDKFFNYMINDGPEFMQGFFISIKEIFDGIKRIFIGIIDFVTGVFSGDWKKAWEGVKNIFKGIVDGLVGIFKAPMNSIIGILNGVISGLNTMIRGLNKISFSIPSWVPLLGGKKFGFNIGQMGKIPYLANGGTLLSGSAIVGEAGPELLMQGAGRSRVVPLTGDQARNTEIIDYERMASSFVKALSGARFEVGPDGMMSIIDKRIINGLKR